MARKQLNSAPVRTARLHPFVILSLAFGAALILIPAHDAVPALYHDLAKNRQPCSDCHTLHYSEAGKKPTATPGALPVTVDSAGPYPQLLVKGTATSLCLFCHDGSDPKAPDVLHDTMYTTPPSGDEHSGAGFFANSGGTASGKGHDLGVLAATVPLSSKTNMTLSCSSCHDPHGTANYRNIVAAPAGGAGVGVVPGTDLFRNAPPGDPPSASATIQAYKESNLGYKANSSLWCAECHDDLKPANNNRNNLPGSRKHHLVDVSLNDPAFASLATPPDAAHWAGGTGSGFGVATEVTDTGTEGVPRLRFQVAGATDFATSQGVAASNQVMCGSCHLAHGGRFKAGLVWPNQEAGPPTPVDVNSGCQQCHNM